jgi:hypothetical protein
MNKETKESIRAAIEKLDNQLEFGWMVVESDEEEHIMPTKDDRLHEFAADCWCKPVPDAEIPFVYWHNAMDGRIDDPDEHRRRAH